MKISVYRKAHFNAAHRLHNPNWSAEKNKTVFGRCNNEHFHGHNYDLEIRVTGEVDPETGFVIDLAVLKDVIELHIEDHLDHKNLNIEIPFFKKHNPTAEYICYYIWIILRDKIDSKHDLGVRLFETPRNFVEYNG